MNDEIIIDNLHWKEFKFIGQDDMIMEGILTQESEEYIQNLFKQTKVSFATEILDRFFPNSCPHCERPLNWRDYITPEEIVEYAKGNN